MDELLKAIAEAIDGTWTGLGESTRAEVAGSAIIVKHTAEDRWLSPAERTYLLRLEEL